LLWDIISFRPISRISFDWIGRANTTVHSLVLRRSSEFRFFWIACLFATVVAASLSDLPSAVANDHMDDMCPAFSPESVLFAVRRQFTLRKDDDVARFACLIHPPVTLERNCGLSAWFARSRQCPRNPAALSMTPLGQGKTYGSPRTRSKSASTTSLSDVDEYLCGAYWRMPHKIDDAGDFSWKDSAAALRSGRMICEYAISGMHRDFRESLYALGHRADEQGINWSFLSAFRDDFRQGIASGFKAGNCGSWHGGSCRTKGWGDGRAADLWISDRNGYPAEDASALRSDRPNWPCARNLAPDARRRSSTCAGQRGLGDDRPDIARSSNSAPKHSSIRPLNVHRSRR
jgi:hypothetical protein